MPDDDINHPIPDLTAYITEGQLIVSRDLQRGGIYPPIDIGGSLSRLMDAGIGQKMTRADHKQVSDQCYAAYAEGRDLRGLVAIIGKESLSERDRLFLEFADGFEKTFVRQGRDENRGIKDTLDKCWELLAKLPEDSLTKIDRKTIDTYHPKHRGGASAD